MAEAFNVNSVILFIIWLQNNFESNTFKTNGQKYDQEVVQPLQLFWKKYTKNEAKKKTGRDKIELIRLWERILINFKIQTQEVFC